MDNLIIAFLNKCFLITSVVFGQVADIAFFAGLSLPPLTHKFDGNFSKNCDFSNFSQFLEKSQFLLDTLVPPLPLEFSNFSKNCDFSNFSQFLLLRANLDISLEPRTLFFYLQIKRWRIFLVFFTAIRSIWSPFRSLYRRNDRFPYFS